MTKKRILLGLILFVLVFVLSGCSKQASQVVDNSQTPVEQQAQSTAAPDSASLQANSKYVCSQKGDCLATTDTCECVTREFYIYNKDNSCENFGCDCIDGKCTKTAPLGK